MSETIITIALTPIGLMLGVELFILWYRRFLNRSFPELNLFPTRSQRETALMHVMFDTENYPKKDTALAGIIGTLFVTIPFMVARIYSLALWVPTVFIVCATPVLLIGYVWLYRKRIHQLVRQRLIDCGIPVCMDCGADLRDETEPQCPLCAREFDLSLLSLTPEQEEPLAATIHADPPHKSKALLLLALLGLVFIFIGIVGFPFVIMKSSGSWQQLSIPGEAVISVDSSEVYRFFVEQSSAPNAESLQSAGHLPIGVEIHVISAETEEELGLEIPARSTTGIVQNSKAGWKDDSTKVRLVRKVRLPSAGKYQVVVSGHPDAGSVYYRPLDWGPVPGVLVLLAFLLAGVLLCALPAVLIKKRVKSANHALQVLAPNWSDVGAEERQ